MYLKRKENIGHTEIFLFPAEMKHSVTKQMATDAMNSRRKTPEPPPEQYGAGTETQIITKTYKLE